MSTIFVIEGTETAAAPARFILRDIVSLVGRSSDCDIVIDEPTVSRRHAEIAIRESGVAVTDLGSRNGTFVNEQPVQKAMAQNGQSLRFGNVSFVLSEQLLQHDERYSDQETEDCYTDEDLKALRARAALLPPAQRRVYELLVSGISDKQMALQLNLSPHTIHTHVRAIYKALRVHSRRELMACHMPRSERRPELS